MQGKNIHPCKEEGKSYEKIKFNYVLSSADCFYGRLRKGNGW